MNTDELFIDVHKLPKPLPKQEVCELFEKIKQGDKDAKEKLVEHNIRLVLFEVTGRFKSVEYDKKELVSIGNVGLMKAITTFDTTKKVEFSTYAIKCIDNEILIFLRKLKKDQNVYSLDRTINHDKDDNELKIKDIISDGTDIVERYTNKETYQIIRQIVKDLPTRDRELIILYFGFNNEKSYTQQEIADRMSVSRSYISLLIAKIVKKIGQQLQKKGVIELREKNSESKEIKNSHYKKIKTIYQYFDAYSKEQVDAMLAKLTEEERALITVRYGEDLNNPVFGNLSKEQRNKFYGNLIPKMKKILSNPNKERKLRNRKEKPNENIPISQVSKTLESKIPIRGEQQICRELTKCSEMEEKQETSNEKEMIREDYIKELELLRTPGFTKIMKTYSPKEFIIASLKFGYIDGKYYSTSEISEFLGIEPKEVIETTRTILLAYKEKMNQIIDKTIQNVVEESEITHRKLHKSLHK